LKLREYVVTPSSSVMTEIEKAGPGEMQPWRPSTITPITISQKVL
jgi:hypothetical protein